ncbi:hypothetical protein [Fluviicola taffensis]|uniref:hypothetical protein n=1 Tax=Fluviicola taffensis TaxID=191579 RepID=UPI0031379D12
MKNPFRFPFILTIFSLTFLSCKTTNTNNAPEAFSQTNVLPDTLYDCQLNGNLSKEERRTISFFRIAKKIKLISFSQKVVHSTPIDKHLIASNYLKDEITLTEDQIDRLTEILYNYNFSKDLNSRTITHGDCYEPRHAIVFLNSSDKVFGYFEFCFECKNHRTFPTKENIGEYCPTKYLLIADFFKSVGITFFEEQEEE